jgi:nicotinate-nucleotide adenylyltransferase
MDKRVSKTRIGILGSSFDPPHLGHLEITKKAPGLGLVDEVWLMVCFRNPWSEEVASVADRLAMAKLLTSKKIKVSDLEIKRGGKSYTIDTVLELKRRFKYNFFWILGSDHLKDLHKFKKADLLLQEMVFLVFPRSKISSSVIRERVKKGQSIEKLVPAQIKKYIEEHKLYV